MVGGGDLAAAASMTVSFHLGLLVLIMFSSGKELSTVGLCRKKPLLIRSESMESPLLPLAINQEKILEREGYEGVSVFKRCSGLGNKKGVLRL